MKRIENAYNAMREKPYPNEELKQARWDWHTLHTMLLIENDMRNDGKRDAVWLDFLRNLVVYEYGYQAGIRAERAKRKKRAKHKA